MSPSSVTQIGDRLFENSCAKLFAARPLPPLLPLFAWSDPPISLPAPSSQIRRSFPQQEIESKDLMAVFTCHLRLPGDHDSVSAIDALRPISILRL